MCGLVAWAGTGGGASAPADTIRRMLRTVLHRGPDEEGYLVERNVALGFSRLSLVALDAVGQPLTSADGRYTLVANGEVYNYRELARVTPGGDACRGGSDCEVLLYLHAAHGPDFLRHIHGMISTIIWDRATNRLILSRDPFGVKPLFYHVNADRVVAASEIKALLADSATPREVNWTASLQAAPLHGVPMLEATRAHTWFSDIRMVEAGTTVEIDLSDGTVTTHRYWHPNRIAADDDSRPGEVVDRFRATLTRSVRESRTADAEVGLMLSGGIDSVSVAALTGPGMATFTILTGSTAGNGDAEWAYRAATLLGHHNHQILIPDDHVPTLDEWLRFLCLMETPLAGMEAYLKYLGYLGAKSVRPQVRGMMIGSGADEFLGGYLGELALGDGWDGAQASLGALARATARSSGPSASHWMDRPEGDLLDPDIVTPESITDPYAAFVVRKYYDVEQYNTWIEDRAASSASVEARVPFLDTELIELTLAIPERLRRELLWDKSVLRDAMRDVLPEPMRAREKQPFFHGAHENHVFDMAVAMLKADDFEMIRLATDGNPTAPLSAERAIAYLTRIERRPSRAGVEFLMRLVNLSLLDRLASQDALGLFGAGAKLPDGVEVIDYADLPAHHRSLLSGVERDPARAVYSFDAECEAVIPLTGDPTVYIARNGEFETVIDEDVPLWSRLIPALDEPRNQQDLAAATDIPGEVLERLLRDGVGAGFVFEELPAADRADMDPAREDS